jgi:hypothetical protein
MLWGQSFAKSVIIDLMGVAYEDPKALNSPTLAQKVNKSLAKWQLLDSESQTKLMSAVSAYRYAWHYS